MRVTRSHSAEFKQNAVQRMLEAPNIKALCRELGVARSIVYRWRNRLQAHGSEGLKRAAGRPPRSKPEGQAPNEAVAELQRKIGQQAVDLDFLTRAFKRVKALPQSSSGSGGTASTE